MPNWRPHHENHQINPHTGYARRYVQKHRHLWEQVNGPVPDGMCLKCLDADKTNTDPSNWELIPRAMLPRLNGICGRGYDAAAPEIKPVIMAITKLEHPKMALVLRKFDTKHSFDGSTKYIRADKVDEHTGIKAKPLEFEKFSDGEYVARAFGYDYWITGEDGIIWQLSVGCGGMDFYNLDCKTLEGAKDAANKHFRAQLAEWLECAT